MKNETQQHTPAPWKISEEDLGTETIRIVTEDEYRIIAGVYSHEEGDDPEYYAPYSEAAANAQLIARAPELLKENQELKRFESLYNKSRIEYKAIQQANYTLKDLNAELLEELKAAKTRLAFLNSDEAKHYSNDNYFWVKQC